MDSVVYRTANILADDPGWWQNDTNTQKNGTNWENQTNPNDISRIGLAADATPHTIQTRTPRMLNKTKIEQMKLNEAVLTTKLGLYYKVSGSQVNYSYNINIEPIGIPMTINSSRSFGEPPPKSQDIYKITRLVLEETGNIASFRAEELNGSLSDNVIINISGNRSEDVIIQITDFNITNTNASFDNATLNSIALMPSNYIAYNRTNISDFNNYPIPVTLENSTDTLRLIFNKSLFTAISNTLELDFNNITFNQAWPPVNYSDRVEPLYEPATLVVEAWS
ncbi:MAG: hypothetical protein WCE94_05765 [Candidatus Methanoperedens sp.]